MNKIWIVTSHEYWHHVRRKGFLVSTFVMPLVFLMLIGLVVFLLVQTSAIKTIGFVDQTQLLKTYTSVTYSDTGLGPVTFQRFTTEAEGITALQANTIDALFVVPPDYLVAGQVHAYARDSLSVLAETYMSILLQDALAQQVATEANPRVLKPLARVTTVVLDAPPDAQQTSLLVVAVPFLFSIMILGATFSGGSYLMTSLAEEKEHRIMEILASSLSPYQLMAGKIAGLGALALTQLLVWGSGLAGIVLLLTWGINIEAGAWLWRGLAIVSFIFVPTYFIIAAALAAIGAAVQSVQQGQQLTGVVTLFCTLPLWLLLILSRNPTGPLALGFSIFPFTSPVTLIIRLMSGLVPWWQVIMQIVWLWLAALFMILLAGLVVKRAVQRIDGVVRWRHVLRR